MIRTENASKKLINGGEWKEFEFKLDPTRETMQFFNDSKIIDLIYTRIKIEEITGDNIFSRITSICNRPGPKLRTSTTNLVRMAILNELNGFFQIKNDGLYDCVFSTNKNNFRDKIEQFVMQKTHMIHFQTRTRART